MAKDPLGVSTYLFKIKCPCRSSHTHIKCPSHPLTLSGPAMPQGDPMGPVIMILWAWLGWLHIERQCRRVPHVVTRVYVDDRSFAGSRVWALSERDHHWSDWSPSGCVKTKPKRSLWLPLLLAEPHCAASCLKLCNWTLSCFVPRKHPRIDACCKTLTLLACAGLPFERYMRACRQFASICYF